MTRLRRLGRVAVGWMGLTAVLIGVPLLLAGVAGDPRPERWPPPGEWWGLLVSGRLSDEALMGGVAVGAWAAWGVLVWEVAAELTARLRGRVRLATTPARPWAWLAGRLVGLALTVSPPAVTLLSEPSLPFVAPPAEAAEAPMAEVSTLRGRDPVRYVATSEYESLWAIAEHHLGAGERFREIDALNQDRIMTDGTMYSTGTRIRKGYELLLPPDAGLGEAESGSTAASPANPVVSVENATSDVRGPATAPTAVLSSAVTHEVEVGDTLWDLAERYYDDGYRWAAIWAANAGLIEDPNLIHSGQQLVMPAIIDPRSDASSDHVVSTTHTVAAGESLSLLASRYYGDEHLWPVIWDANRADIVKPDLIFVGQQLVVPPVAESPDASSPPPAPSSPPTAAPPPPSTPAAVPAVPTTTPSATVPPAAVSDHDVPSPAQPDTTLDVDTTSVPVGMLGVAGTILAAGVLGTWHRRRRRRAVTLPAGLVVPPPPPKAQTVHAEVCRADLDAATWLDRVLRHLAHSVASSAGDGWPRPVVVQDGSGWVDVLMAEPWAETPLPWRAELSGRVWHWDPPPGWELPEADPQPWSPLPGLATVGTQEADNARLLVDLEAAGVVGVVGDADGVAALARSMTLELACSPLREAFTGLTVAGFEVPGVEAFDFVRTVDSFADCADSMLALARSARRVLDQLGMPSTFAARSSGHLELGAAEMVIIGQPPTEDTFGDLCQLLADRQGGVIVVCVGWCPPTGLAIEVNDGQVRLPALGLTATAQGLSADTAAHIGAVVHAPDGPAEQLPLLDVPELLTPGLATAGDGYEDRPWEVLVRLLGGPPTVLADGRRLSPKQVAVIAYVGLRRSVSVDKLRDAAWGGRDISPKRVLGVLSELRAALGDNLIPPVHGGQVTVGAGVATDVELFERRVSYARRQPPTEAMATLRAALELVTAEPFAFAATDRDNYAWVDSENWGSRWEAKVTTAAHRLADLHLEVGDADGARWAADRGLSVSPAHKELTKHLIRAYGQLGQPEAAVKVAHEYARVIEDLGVTDDDDRAGESVWDVLQQVAGRGRAGRPGGSA